ncbi:MAG: TetR/AcrR family transcriptional regulator [Clostridium sp.]|nr:TetR/AcrR family transcriptional regulator [Clostridium sp.]
MPPKAKYTEQQIINIAYDIVRTDGANALTARNLAKALGASTGTIFSMFDTVTEIQNAVIDKGKARYAEYIQEGLRQPIPFKGAGMKYIQFAKDEPELFKLLFMTGDGNEHLTGFLPAYDENADIVLDAFKNSYSIDSDKARNIYNHLSVYAYGFAALFAQQINMFTMEDIDRMMSELFMSLTK